MENLQEKKDLSLLSDEELVAEMARRREASKNQERMLKLSFEKDKNDFLQASCLKFIQLSNELRELKLYTITEANKLWDRMYENQGKTPKEVNTFTLKSTNFKITVDRQERFEFTEDAIVHIQSIKEMFASKFAERNKGFYKFLESILMRNTKGEFDPKLLAKGRQQVNELGDVALISEFEKLENCQRVVGSSLYCRAYKLDDQGKWNDINVQFSSL